MQSFATEAKKSGLTKDSSFFKIAQLAIKAYYLIPYPSQKYRVSKLIFRLLHGGLHVSSATLNLEMFIELYKKYKPELLRNPDGSDLSAKQIKLLKLAVIYHDSANTSEGPSDEKEHAENFRRDMLALGYNLEAIEPFYNAIQYKDSRPGKGLHDPEKHGVKTLFQKLLQDADSLDIIRARYDFDKKHLEIVKDLADCPGFSQELDDIIQNHEETITTFYGRNSAHPTQLHEDCESSYNCYFSVRQAEYNMLLQHIIFECLIRGKAVTMEDVDPAEGGPQFTLLDIYNRKHSAAVIKTITSLLASKEESPSTAGPLPVIPDLAMQLFNEGGCLVRTIKGTYLDRELEQLISNTSALESEGIADAKSLRGYLEKQSKIKMTPQGFKWRPSSFIEAGSAIGFCSLGACTLDPHSGNITVIIDPNPSKKTISPYLYKRNAGSASVVTGLFRYEQDDTGSLKNKKDLKGISEKFKEMNRRRQGIESDLNLHYFGQEQFSFNEVLITYRTQGIIGIIVPPELQAARDALLFRAKLGRPLRTFYRYSATMELVPVSDREIINQGQLGQMTRTSADALEDLRNEVNCLLLSPENAIQISDSLSKRDVIEHGMIGATVKTIVISCNLEGMNQEYADKIKQSFKNVTYLDPDNSLMNLTSSGVVNERGSILSASIQIYHTVHSHVNKQNTITLEQYVAKKLLEEIRLSLTNPAESKLTAQENDLTHTLDVNKIHNIENISGEAPLSKDNPLKFRFTHPEEKDVQCVAWVKLGRPVIEYHLPDKTIIDSYSQLLPNIAKKYFQEQISVLNKVVSHKETAQWLIEHSIKNMKLNFMTSVGRHNDKSYISIEFDSVEKEKLNIAKAFIADLFGLKELKKTEIRTGLQPEAKASDGRITFGISEVQNLDLFRKNLEQRALTSVLPTTPKKSV